MKKLKLRSPTRTLPATSRKYFYRNQSADEFLAEMIQLKHELNAIGNNFNQAVHKLHTLDHTADIKAWAIHNDSAKIYS
jgi:transcriptional regulator of NAD metabolism